MIRGSVLRLAIKQRMQKDIDEVGKICRSIKAKIEELDREVGALPNLPLMQDCFEVLKLLTCLIFIIQNLTSRQKPGYENGTAVDRSRTATTL